MISRFRDDLEFLSKFEDLLKQDEIKNNLMLVIAKRATPENSLFIASEIDNRELLGLLAGKNLIISSNTLSKDVYREMVRYMKDIDYPGIIGSKEECMIYKNVFEEETKKTMVTSMDQRIYKCTEVASNNSLKGVRLAEERDFEVLRHWFYEFNLMIEGDVNYEETDKALHWVIEQKRLFVLEKNGALVSMAVKARTTEHSQTVGMVYTPKEYRNNGYASRVVEYVTRHILEYKEMATLYTDLSNPTSNSIYMKIGYKPHCDSIVLDIV